MVDLSIAFCLPEGHENRVLPPVISGNFAAKRPPYPLMTGSETTSDAHQLR